jgi:hypothetical protein
MFLLVQKFGSDNLWRKLCTLEDSDINTSFNKSLKISFSVTEYGRATLYMFNARQHINTSFWTIVHIFIKQILSVPTTLQQ